MAVSIDNYLRTLASSFYLKNNSDEVKRIDNSISNLYKNLDANLGKKINRRFIFGSYDRDTILPRKFDKHSDVDIMVIFNHTDYERDPETYRRWLHSFAEDFYKDRYGSKVVKTFPTVTLELGSIKYDLVPAKEETNFFGTKIISIPGTNGWRSTDPNDVKQKLTAANTRFNNVVRPIIRLMKAWNCYNDYPFDSYLLELKITSIGFGGNNVESGFFYAANNIKSWDDSQARTAKIDSLLYNINEAKKALANDNLDRAKHWIHRVLPTS